MFTSIARVQAALQTSGKWRDWSGMGRMLGQELLHVLSMTPDTLPVTVNIGGSCGARMMDMKMIKSIVDGSALYIPTPGEVAMGGLVISLPDHQPDRLKVPLTKFFSGIPEVKAAWLFCEEEPKPPQVQVYVVGLAIVGGERRRRSGTRPPWRSRASVGRKGVPARSSWIRKTRALPTSCGVNHSTARRIMCRRPKRCSGILHGHLTSRWFRLF
jgi:hypothetical protein